MKKASISEAKNNLSALIDRVRSGSSVLIVDRGQPVARLDPVTGDDDERLARLVRNGVVRPARAGRNERARSISSSQPPRPKAGTSALRALLAERRDAR